MVNIEKYKNDGWGLSKQCFENIEKCLDDFKIPVIVEFGSGISTSFFIDYLNENDKKGVVVSFDDSEEYSTKIKDIKLNLSIKKLVECDKINYEEMFKNKAYSHEKMRYRTSPPHTRQENCFYDVNNTNLPGNIDLVVIDGPHGNGRNIAFLHLINKLLPGSYVVIDDYNHYDFCERFEYLFPNCEIINKSTTGNLNQWELGGNYVIYKILDE